nr:TPA_asm: m43.6 sORF [Murid betaherpesvirus 1]DBA07769.1 TPA_asm: m43.6 sORF [Murid betaherpesvirus 1]
MRRDVRSFVRFTAGERRGGERSSSPPPSLSVVSRSIPGPE